MEQDRKHSENQNEPIDESTPMGLVGTPGNDLASSPSFFEILERLWQKREIIWRASYVGLLVVTMAAFLIEPQYESTANLMPPEKQSNAALGLLVGGVDDRLGALAADAVGLKSSGATYIAILHSRTVAERLIHRFDLQRRYRSSTMQDTVNRLADKTDISEDRKSGVLSVTVTDYSPKMAQQIAGGYVEELNRLSAELATSAARRERQFLETRLVTIKADLETASKRLSQFSSQNSTLDPREQGKAGIEAAARLQAELIATEAQVSGLERVYSQENVRVQTLRAQAAELRRQLNKLTGQPATDDTSRMNYPSLRELPSLGVTYYDLYRDVRIQEAVFETLTKQYELAKVQEAKELPTVRVLDEADYPEVKNFPKRGFMIVFGTVFSGLLSAAWLMLQDRWGGLASTHPLRSFCGQVLVDASRDLQAFRARIAKAKIVGQHDVHRSD